MKRVLQILPVGVFLLYSSLFFFTRPHLPTLDLGRHIVNGREILAHWQVFGDNHYSFTHPDFPAVNHHWLFGVFAYLGYELGGFPLLVILNAALILSALAGIVWFASRNSSRIVASTFGFLLLPLFADRNQVRPESFSFIFTVIFFLVLWNLAKKKMGRAVLALVALQLFWVNTHLFFVFGWVLVLAFLLRALLARAYRWQLQSLVLLLLGVVLVSFCNPSGWRGVLEPFTIFSEYAYPVAENQSLRFFLRYHPSSEQWNRLIVSVATLWALMFSVWKSQDRWRYFPLAVLTIGFGAVAVLVTRVYSFFAIFALPVLAISATQFRASEKISLAMKSTVGSMLSSLTIFLLGIVLIGSGLFIPNWQRIGLTVTPHANDAAEFFKQISPQGNVFNNYDIGSYLIFHLYPEWRVFVDNRPEAYPSSFFTDEYIAAQESEEVWQKLVEKYDIGSIFVYYRDGTDWAQPFLVRRLQDPDWVAVFADQDALIFLQNRPEHKDLIEQYQLPEGVIGY